MRLLTEPYLVQLTRWPEAERHILAQFDDTSVVVYQAFRSGIGRFAATHGYFGDGFSLNRMSWIKPNFLWLMYRSGWGTKEGQETILAIWLKRSFFDGLLAEAVHSAYVPRTYEDANQWKTALDQADVRLQWDPDHDPAGVRVERRALQLGLRRAALARYARESTIHIADITAFAQQQREYVQARAYEQLTTPRESVYPIADAQLAADLGVVAHT